MFTFPVHRTYDLIQKTHIYTCIFIHQQANAFVRYCANPTIYFVGINTLYIYQSLLSTDIGCTATGYDTFFNSCTSGAKSIVNTVFLLLHLHLAVGTYIKNGNTTCQFSKTLLQFLLIIRRCGEFNLLLNLGNTILNSLLLASTINDCSIVLRNGHLVASTQHFECSLLQLQTFLLADNNTTCQDSDILKHSLTTIAETRSLDSTNLQTATQTVDNQCGKSL